MHEFPARFCSSPLRQSVRDLEAFEGLDLLLRLCFLTLKSFSPGLSRHGQNLPLTPYVKFEFRIVSSDRDYRNSPRIGHQDIRVLYSFFRYICLEKLTLYLSIFPRVLYYLLHLLRDLITLGGGNR